MELYRFLTTNQNDYQWPKTKLFPPRYKTFNPVSFEMEMEEWLKLAETRKNQNQITDCHCTLKPSKILDDLNAKYPAIYEALKKAPPGYLKARVDRDRFLTVNRIDYGNLKATVVPTHVRDVFKYFEPPEKPHCPSMTISPYDLCQTKPQKSVRLNGITGSMREQLNPKIYREEIFFKKEKQVARFGGTSEYKGAICKTGETIIKENIPTMVKYQEEQEKRMKMHRGRICENYKLSCKK